jgi:hypothetical protein
MGAIINMAMAATLTAGPSGLEAPIQLQGPSVRVVEGVFVEDMHDDSVRFFEQGADLPPQAERLAVLTRSGVMGRIVRVLPDAENELALVAQRPEAFDLYVPQAEGEQVEGVVGVIDDEDGYPLAFVTSERTDIIGIVVATPGEGMAVVEREGGNNGPIELVEGDSVIGIVTVNPRGGKNVLMDHLNPYEVQALLEMHQPAEFEWIPGQN